jgi:hypothetical protein
MRCVEADIIGQNAEKPGSGSERLRPTANEICAVSLMFWR